MDLEIDCDDKYETGRYPQSEFVIAPPRLGQTLRMLAFPDFWVGTYYARGTWFLKKGRLSSFIGQLLTRPTRRYVQYFKFISKSRGPFFALRRYLLDSKESRDVAAHYEIESKFYRLFLDEEMIYTCAFFYNEDDTLETAQKQKLELVERRLKLPKDEARILDVGSGWGALERHLTKSNPT